MKIRLAQGFNPFKAEAERKANRLLAKSEELAKEAAKLQRENAEMRRRLGIREAPATASRLGAATKCQQALAQAQRPLRSAAMVQGSVIHLCNRDIVRLA